MYFRIKKFLRLASPAVSINYIMRTWDSYILMSFKVLGFLVPP